jgi:YesN/AraC family two-component response regulator
MFKVIVIDDEPVIVRDIKNTIESTDEEFHVIGTATDGSTGLKLIHERKPDLVFVDICMPVMDGLQLITALREEGNMTPVVILSGYQEFDYAKKAISLEVLDYLVKPMNPLSLKKFLDQLKNKLLLNQYEQRKQCLEQIFHFNPLSQGQEELFGEAETFLLAKICFGAFNFIRNNQFAPVYSYSSMISVKEICDMKWGRTGYWMIDGKYENELLLVISCVNRKEREAAGELYQEIKSRLIRNYFITFVTSDSSKKITQLREELTILEGQLYHKSVFGKSSFIRKDGKDASYLQENKETIDYSYVGALVIAKKKTELLDAVKSILLKCKEADCTQANLITRLKKLMRSCCPREASDDIDFMINLIVVSSLDYEVLYMKLSEAIIEYSDIDDKNSVEDANAKYIVYKVQEYLDSHYQEKVLIQNVADKFGFNCSYLCHLFRKHKNVSPNEYIIMKRIEMAKELFRLQNNLSIKEVAAIVGYEDQYYFSRLFKTYVGTAPTDYKNSQSL